MKFSGKWKLMFFVILLLAQFGFQVLNHLFIWGAVFEQKMLLACMFTYLRMNVILYGVVKECIYSEEK